jgi:hypothetical protein
MTKKTAANEQAGRDAVEGHAIGEAANNAANPPPTNGAAVEAARRAAIQATDVYVELARRWFDEEPNNNEADSAVAACFDGDLRTWDEQVEDEEAECSLMNADIIAREATPEGKAEIAERVAVAAWLAKRPKS